MLQLLQAYKETSCRAEHQNLTAKHSFVPKKHVFKDGVLEHQRARKLDKMIPSKLEILRFTVLLLALVLVLTLSVTSTSECTSGSHSVH